MNKIADFNKFKKAKVIVKELDVALKIINLAITGLKPFKKYYPISMVLAELNMAKTSLEPHYEANKEILDTRGDIK